jgi:hypothetical protein
MAGQKEGSYDRYDAFFRKTDSFVFVVKGDKLDFGTVAVGGRTIKVVDVDVVNDGNYLREILHLENGLLTMGRRRPVDG